MRERKIRLILCALAALTLAAALYLLARQAGGGELSAAAGRAAQPLLRSL